MNARAQVTASRAEAAEKVLQLLAALTETEEVRSNLDVALYDTYLLDSMLTVRLIVGLEEQFGIQVSPAEFDRDSWATPRKIVADVQRRLAQ